MRNFILSETPNPVTNHHTVTIVCETAEERDETLQEIAEDGKEITVADCGGWIVGDERPSHACRCNYDCHSGHWYAIDKVVLLPDIVVSEKFPELSAMLARIELTEKIVDNLNRQIGDCQYQLREMKTAVSLTITDALKKFYREIPAE